MLPISRTERNTRISLSIINSSPNDLIGRDESNGEESCSDEAFEFLIEPRGFDPWTTTKNIRGGGLKATTQHRKNQERYDGIGEDDSDSSYLSQGSEIAIDMLAHWDCKWTRKKKKNPFKRISSQLEPLCKSRSSNDKLSNEVDNAQLNNGLPRPAVRFVDDFGDIANFRKSCVSVSSESVIVMNSGSRDSKRRAKIQVEKVEDEDLIQFMPTELLETHL